MTSMAQPLRPALANDFWATSVGSSPVARELNFRVSCWALSRSKVSRSSFFDATIGAEEIG